MAAATLESVVQQLQVNKRSTDDVVKTLRETLNIQKRNILDQLEAERDAKNAKKEVQKQAQAPGGSPRKGKGFSLEGLMLGGLKGLSGKLAIGIGVITAGIGAMALAFAGLRGWEKLAVTKIKEFVKFPTVVTNSVIKLRNASLAMFGLTAAGLPIRDANTGRMTKGLSIRAQIAARLEVMKANFLKNFGIGADGKNVARQGPKGMTKQPLHIRAGRAIIRLLSPVTSFLSGITSWFTGAGSKITKFVKTFLKPAGGVLKLMGKILWPIGVIISMFDGVTAFREQEGTFYDKLGAGIGGLIGSFVGAPFDLAKGAINYLLKKIFPGLTTEDGSWDQSTIMGSWLSKFESFSIADFISNLIEGIFALPKAAINWIKTLFTDPTEALSQLWQGLLKVFSVGGKAVKGILDILFFPVNKAIDWVKGKFGWSEDDAPPFSITDFVSDIFGKIIGWFKKLPARIMITIREFTTAAIAAMKLDFMSLVDSLKSIPSKIKLYVESLLPTWLGGISDTEYNKRITEINTPNEARLAERQAIIDQLKKDLADLAQERQAMNAPVVVGGDTNTNNTVAMTGSAVPVVVDTMD